MVWFLYIYTIFEDQKDRIQLAPKKKSLNVHTYFDVHDLGDFPQVNEKTNEDADLNHKVGLIVQNV